MDDTSNKLVDDAPYGKQFETSARRENKNQCRTSNYSGYSSVGLSEMPELWSSRTPCLCRLCVAFHLRLATKTIFSKCTCRFNAQQNVLSFPKLRAQTLCHARGAYARSTRGEGCCRVHARPQQQRLHDHLSSAGTKPTLPCPPDHQRRHERRQRSGSLTSPSPVAPITDLNTSLMAHRNRPLADYRIEELREVYLEVFCTTRTSVENPLLAPSGNAGRKSFLIIEKGYLDQHEGFWVEDENDGAEGFDGDAFWVYDDDSAAWFQRRFQGRMKRGQKGRRKGKGKGGKGRGGRRFF